LHLSGKRINSRFSSLLMAQSHRGHDLLSLSMAHLRGVMMAHGLGTGPSAAAVGGDGGLGPYPIHSQILLYKKKIFRHIKISAYAWNTKYR
jgi:hypothetical protein